MERLKQLLRGNSLDPEVVGLLKNRRLVAGGLLAMMALVLAQVMLEDNRVDVRHLVPPGGLCANQDDMYDDVKHVCQVQNIWASAFLLGRTWVSCAPNMPAAAMLRGGQGSGGNFWYISGAREEVRRFYKTCVPNCAGSADTYHSSTQFCLVGNDIARTWLSGNGQSCAGGGAGEIAIRAASRVVGDGNFWYKPEVSSKVSALYKSCTATCAVGDKFRQDGGWLWGGGDGSACVVMDKLALAFLRGDRTDGKCDGSSPGRSAVKMAKDKINFWYDTKRGDEVEDWYTSCAPGRIGGRANGNEGEAPATVAPDGKLSFPYPKAASQRTPTVCNLSGKTYWFSGSDATREGWKRGKGHTFVKPMSRGAQCVTMSTIACKGGYEGKRKHCGFVAPCDSKRCHMGDAVGVIGGINIINGNGEIEWLPAQS